ncbi:tryptophan 2,3-dioxygenase family protein [Hyalangium rubrum]|uniref:Tryptophan 2,3-dioxygenase family protein n=1 Tax=Hyalangium rubrum TaxID=3103134 RepID=A0ABU5GY79_9BACT|nr:tryptophan 2,3-dioxygenase family protein [Hyalangium sp. s54d21]MDY7225834.1 tryptophan 2,3-dioxygenase family protein [Hyalangium sp. s54d21]
MFNALLKKWVGTGQLDYEIYLKTPTLLNLQTPREQLVHHDELLFQIVHQAQELWLKQVSMEGIELVAEIDGDLLWGATTRMERMLRVMRCMVAELNILETMTPDSFQIVRRSLGNGSGQESPGYNMVRLLGDGMEAALERILTRRQVRLLDVYRIGGSGSEDLKRLCEQMVDFDELFQNWLYTHYQMVRRIIGVDRSIKALDGLPTQVLAGRMTLPLFRKLWEVRAEMTAEWKREGGFAIGAARQPGSPQAEGSSGYGSGAHGASGYGSGSHGSSGYGSGSHGASGYGSGSHAPSGYGSGSHAPSGYGSGAHAPPPHAPPAAVAHAPSAPPPVTQTAAVLQAAVVPPVPVVPPPAVAPAPAPTQTAMPESAAADDPWSRPEPPTSRRPLPDVPPVPRTSGPPDDPWSRPEPPTSRRPAPTPESSSSSSSSSSSTAQEPQGPRKPASGTHGY